MSRVATREEEEALTRRLASFEPVRTMPVHRLDGRHESGPNLATDDGVEVGCVHLVETQARPRRRRCRSSRPVARNGGECLDDHRDGRDEDLDEDLDGDVVERMRGPKIGPAAGEVMASEYEAFVAGELGVDMVTLCNEPLTLGYADNSDYEIRSQTQSSPVMSQTGTADVVDARLNCTSTPRVVLGIRQFQQILRSRGWRPADVDDSRLGTDPSPCVVCGSDVRVNAMFCVLCAYVTPLLRRHYSVRILQLEDDDV